MSQEAGITVRRIAIAVRNLDQSRALYEILFGAEFERPGGERVKGVRCVVWRREGGEPAVELVEPQDVDGPVARFIRKHGEGVHHLSLAVSDLEAAVERLSATGARLVRTESYYRRPDGSRLSEIFLHPKDASGVLFHLVEDE